jgi:hypothetical protein
MATGFSVEWSQLGAGVAAVGSLGTAAFGFVESAGKAFAFTVSIGRDHRQFNWGLPYVGIGAVNRAIKPLRPALRCAYGDNYAEIIAQQYRSNRSAGSAPDTIMQGVRLGLPFLSLADATALISAVWHMDPAQSAALAQGLQAPGAAPAAPAGGGAAPGAAAPAATAPAVALAARFSTALDARITAAFQLADERYETVAKTLAGVCAVGLALLFNWGLRDPTKADQVYGVYPPLMALAIGLVAVPLAPVAKDISTSLQNALTAFKSIGGKAS